MSASVIPRGTGHAYPGGLNEVGSITIEDVTVGTDGSSLVCGVGFFLQIEPDAGTVSADWGGNALTEDGVEIAPDGAATPGARLLIGYDLPAGTHDLVISFFSPKPYAAVACVSELVDLLASPLDASGSAMGIAAPASVELSSPTTGPATVIAFICVKSSGNGPGNWDGGFVAGQDVENDELDSLSEAWLVSPEVGTFPTNNDSNRDSRWVAIVQAFLANVVVPAIEVDVIADDLLAEVEAGDIEVDVVADDLLVEVTGP